MKYTLFVLLVILDVILCAERKNPFGVHLTAMKCEFGSVCERSACKLKPINRTVTAMTMGCYLIRPQKSLKIKIAVFQKSSSNAYHPGSFRFVQDYCAMMRGEMNPITQTFMNIFEMLRKSLHPCPVEGKYLLENVAFDSSIVPSHLLPTGDFRVDIRPFNELNETIFYIQQFLTIKNPFF